MILTAKEACDRGLTPLDVYDANGMVIKKKIKKFDTETGQVEFYVFDENGKHLFNEAGDDVLTAIEFFPAPLIWKKLDKVPDWAFESEI